MALTPEQIQEIRDLRLNQKKTPKEIIAAFKEKGIEVKGWEVSYHCRPLKAKPSGGARPKGKQRPRRRQAEIRTK